MIRKLNARVKKVHVPGKMKSSKTVRKRCILTAGGIKVGATCRQHNAMSASNTTMSKTRTQFLHPTRIKQVKKALAYGGF